MRSIRSAAAFILIAALIAAPLATRAAAAGPTLSDVTYVANAQNATVAVQQVNGESYMFLPSSADLKAMSFTFKGGSVRVTANGKSVIVTSGQTFDLEALYGSTPSDGIYVLTLTRLQEKLTLRLMVSRNVGSMYITSEDPVKKGRAYVDAVKGNKGSGQMTLLTADGTVVYAGKLSQIKGRGNSTWGYDKKPYQIKIDKKTDLLQTGDPNEAAKTWVLLANYYDDSFILNSLTFDLADALGMPYSPHSKPIDLYYDGEYRGTYLLCEKTEIKGGRVDINDLEGDFEDANPDVDDFDDLPTAEGTNAYGNAYQYVTGLTDPDDLSGGYLLEMDFYARAIVEKSYFATGHGYYIVSKSPEYLSENAMNYISEFYQEFEDAVWNGGVNPTTGKRYTEYMDLYSLAKSYVILELSQDGDAFGSSTFFYKPQGEEMLYAGPVWDFDSAYGGFYLRYKVTDIVAGKTDIGKKLLSIPSFCRAVEEVYRNELYPLVTEVLLNPDPSVQVGRLRSIAGYTAEVSGSLRMDNVLWAEKSIRNNFSARTISDFISTRNQFLYDLQWTEGSPIFDDIPRDAWYLSSVEDMVDRGILNGVGDGLFDPDGTMTRGMIAVMLYRFAGEPETEFSGVFSDVSEDQWFAKGISWAADAGIVNGYPEGDFRPDDEITRQDFMVMLCRYAQYCGAAVTAPELSDAFEDLADVSDYAADALAWGVDRGLIMGTSETTLSPNDSCLRHMAAVILQRYCALFDV